MKNRLLIIIFILGVNLVKAQPTATHCEYISQKANAVIEYVQNATKLAKNNQLNDTIIPAVKAKGRFYFSLKLAAVQCLMSFVQKCAEVLTQDDIFGVMTRAEPFVIIPTTAELCSEYKFTDLA